MLKARFLKVRLIKSIDNIFGTIIVKALPLPGAISQFKPDSILFIRPGGIGDAILLIPAIQAIKKKYPYAVIDVLAEKRNSSAFKLCPYVNEIYLYDKPKQLLKAILGKKDVVVDTEQWHRMSAVVARLSGARVSVGYATNERKRLFSCQVIYSHDDYEANSFLHLLAPLGIAESEEIKFPFLVVPDDARKNAQKLLGDLANKNFVVIFPGASIPERRWGVEKFSALAGRLAKIGYPIVVVGGEADAFDGKQIVGTNLGLNLAGKCSLAETAAVIERSALLISGDSGVLHMGVGLDRPTVSLFGPGIAKKWAPVGDKHIIINRKLPCSPCTRFGYTPKCLINAKCLADISIEEVVKAVLQLKKLTESS